MQQMAWLKVHPWARCALWAIIQRLVQAFHKIIGLGMIEEVGANVLNNCATQVGQKVCRHKLRAIVSRDSLWEAPVGE